MRLAEPIHLGMFEADRHFTLFVNDSNTARGLAG